MLKVTSTKNVDQQYQRVSKNNMTETEKPEKQNQMKLMEYSEEDLRSLSQLMRVVQVRLRIPLDQQWMVQVDPTLGNWALLSIILHLRNIILNIKYNIIISRHIFLPAISRRILCMPKYAIFIHYHFHCCGDAVVLRMEIDICT